MAEIAERAHCTIGHKHCTSQEDGRAHGDDVD
jgi:hypothetical protein